ncbi:class I SAM-dependent methyltransferase [Nocardia jejuensis]|uniref:class I SAM-dependent methyltransferase n=1 Tax=Nocardia jejuensis TaxID=328049 RepID=UPI00082E13E5|nr:class I SAM-dependent methyltransferase [Nocardia jejuensis]
MRTDDDSWDITESVGATAIGVAAMRAHETRRDDAVFRDPYAEKLVAAVGSESWGRMLAAKPRSDRERLGSAYVNGVMGHFLVARTVYFDEYFADAVADGIRQIVILASGLDARAYRMRWPSGTVIFELDQPKVLEFKATALADSAPAADRREVPIDLRQDWPKALLDKGFDPSRPTAWLAEGLLRYLPGAAQDQLLANLVELSAPGSRMALNIGTGERALSPELRERRAKALAEAGIRIDLEQLWYPWEDRRDPREWFAEQGWRVSPGDPEIVLATHGRTVPEEARPDMGTHILMTAIRPRGDDTL